MCGASIPANYLGFTEVWNDPVAMRDAGISYAIDQILTLVANGVDGVHILYNERSLCGKRISDSVTNLVKRINKKDKLVK